MGEREDYEDPDQPARPPSLLAMALAGGYLATAALAVIFIIYFLRIARQGP
jgi:hypothetical protein